MLDDLLEGHVEAAAAMGLPLPQWSHGGRAPGPYVALGARGAADAGEVTGEEVGIGSHGEVALELNRATAGGEMPDEITGEITGEMTDVDQVYSELWRASRRFTAAAGLAPRSLEEEATEVTLALALTLSLALP